MKTLLILAAIAVIVYVIIRVRVKRNQKPAEAPRPRTDPLRDEFTEDHNDPYKAKLGDMIELMGVTYYVRGIINLSEDGWDWRELYLDDGSSNKGWLSMELDPDLQLTWWTDLGEHGKQPTKTLTLNGTVFTREELGTAHFHTEGVTGLRATGICRYSDYSSKDGRMVSLESWSDEGVKWEMSSGMEILPSQLMVLPVRH